ncbi:hypothetical protein BCY91_10980 [Pelobium manganitolerans]|uniref:DUF3945 domain-containing protein n=1 Tax=Pelobium manganitolerans TaxID=1842495 RepID=A0A419S221_9SPHI|nr:hypothetical protein [Pelobium manganitolerans]RKD12768.1 hypothetical protein BCY91_10980 [Pelobium manganitolerans]
MKNLEYLSNQVFYSGFGRGLEQELKDKLELGDKSFSLAYNGEYGTDKISAVLNFSKSATSELYFFNSYDLALHKSNGKSLNQRFFIGKENNITQKEAYNLLSGRAIYKTWTKLEKVGEGTEVKYQPTEEKYDAWLQLDLATPDEHGNYKAQRYHENYHYDIEKSIDDLGFSSGQNALSKEQLIESLKKGNRQAMVMMDGDNSVKIFIEANPKERTLNVYEPKPKQELEKAAKIPSETTVKKDGKKQKKQSV